VDDTLGEDLRVAVKPLLSTKEQQAHPSGNSGSITLLELYD